VWEEVSDDDVPAPIALASVKEEAANKYAHSDDARPAVLSPLTRAPCLSRHSEAAAAAAAKKKGTTQGSIMSFFGKKK
jgi:hypothetical protein